MRRAERAPAAAGDRASDRRGLSRRRFLQGAAAFGAFSVVPRGVLGGGGQVPPSERLNVAFIGVGSQGLRVMLDFLREPDVQAIAVCDPNRESADYPQWSESEFRDRARSLLGATSGWDWLSPNRPIQLTSTTRATSGVAGRDPCRRIVEAYYGARDPSGQYRGCAAYGDFRECLEKEKDLDAVVVGATDHLHAAIAVAAMKKGKHVFCQKPMTRTVHEARRMAEVAREAGVATQVAVGNQASEDTRVLREWLEDGAIGAVREVINWSSRPFWPQGLDRPPEPQPVPAGLDWDLWLGPAPERPFHRAYLPFVWRGWCDFGGGALGDMGCYSFDTIFRALKLEAPASVEASSTERHDDSFPLASIIHFDFPARGAMPPVRLTWYDGGLKPPRLEELEAGAALPDEGLVFIGERGKILCRFNGGRPRLIPEERMKSYRQPAKTLPRSPGNVREWLDAAKGKKEKPGANFEFSGPVTEAVQLGNVALRSGERIIWDRAGLKAANLPAADRYLRPEVRTGWTL
jgi:predicted dehydrogenase